MSISYFIVPFDPLLWKDTTPSPLPQSDLHLDSIAYAEALQRQWPYARVSIRPESSTYLLWWELNTGRERGIVGGLQSNHQCVSFGLGSQFIEYIAWHRRIVPERYQLFLHHSSSWDRLKLTPNLSEQVIRQFCNML